MSAAATGRIHGTTIDLDAPLPSLEGQRVRLVVEPIDELAASVAELESAWAAWVARANQHPDGPLAADDEFPE